MMDRSSHYTIGIDLGTTNSVVAYIDHRASKRHESPAIQVFRVPQLVAEGEIRALPTLPSFLYFPTRELSAGGVKLPWEERPTSVVGAWAREQGALVPARQVSSAKSWLCHGAVDRRANILPWEAEPPEPMISPVEVSARFLSHLLNAWNSSALASGGAQTRFENQEIVLTVPASFDEEARELTVEAAHEAGLNKLTLLEEPLAAFYAWIAAHQDLLNLPASRSFGQNRELATKQRALEDGDLVLVADVGGGTSDFSLVRVSVINGDVRFERIAIGEHLLLGGDNLDLALARIVEEKLRVPKMGTRQRNALRRACCAAKERLLSEPSLERLPINVLGGGRAVVGGLLSAELSRNEVLEVLTSGFLPLTSPTDLPAQDRRIGLRELGLPYASEPAITKHLAAFLTSTSQAAASAETEPKPSYHAESAPQMLRPDAVLFNGGFFAPLVAQEKLVEAMAGWFSSGTNHWQPRILSNNAPESAVAIGAAYYGQARRPGGLRIRAGSARSYYVGVQSERRLQAVCVLPAGIEEGTTLLLPNREFAVLTNQPVSFNLYSSTTRRDQHGDVAVFEEEQIHRHAPLVTTLPYGKRSRQIELGVQLKASFTEVGTLELWCESLKTPHRWRLQFELRGDKGRIQAAAPIRQQPLPAIPEESLDSAEKLVRAVFRRSHAAPGGEAIGPEALVSKLESTLGRNKESWPLDGIRKLCDILAEAVDGRAKSERHEARWLNMFGFCLRPGFGALRDDWRVSQALRLHESGLVFPSDLQCQVQCLVLWRRVAGGLSRDQQREQYQEHASVLGVRGKKVSGQRLNRQLEHEGWRLLASLEHLPVSLRAALGEELLARIKKEPSDKVWLWSLGRLGSRIPLYGPTSCVVAVEVASKWLKTLIDLPVFTSDTASAVVQLGSRTNDRLRDIADSLRQTAIVRLEAAGVPDELSRGLQEYVPAAQADALRIFGESLPAGLRLVSCGVENAEP